MKEQNNVKRRKIATQSAEVTPAENSITKKDFRPNTLNFYTVPKFPHQKVFIRIVVVTAVFIIVYCSITREKEKKFAQFKETIPLRSMSVDCSPDYSTEIAMYPQCVPRACGRFVTDSIVTQRETSALLSLAKEGFKYGLSAGSASILDLHSGALSKGENFVNIYKLDNAKDILKMNGFQVYKQLKTKILHAISQKFDIDGNYLYLTHPTFFSRITNATAKSPNDEYWHPHVDKETYESFHYTSLVYLADFGKDFTGGRFLFIEKDNRTKTVVEPKVGRTIVFTSGAENLHSVEKVQEGVRYALTVSFTCDKKFAIEDPSSAQK